MFYIVRWFILKTKMAEKEHEKITSGVINQSIMLYKVNGCASCFEIE